MHVPGYPCLKAKYEGMGFLVRLIVSFYQSVIMAYKDCEAAIRNKETYFSRECVVS